MIWKLLLSMIGGVVMHLLFYKPTRPFGPRWGMMIRYAIGSLAVMPFRLLISDELHTLDKHPHEKQVASDLLALGSFGTGVLIGHAAETIIGGEDE